MRARVVILSLVLLAIGATAPACDDGEQARDSAGLTSSTTSASASPGVRETSGGASSESGGVSSLPSLPATTGPVVSLPPVKLPSLSVAPLNPAFLDSLLLPITELWPSAIGQPLGLRPLAQDFGSLRGLPVPLIPDADRPFSAGETPGDTLVSDSGTASTALPTSLDLRTRNKLTEVRDQNPYGTCWSFATLGSLESRLLPGRRWDFSEDNMVLNSGFDHEGSAYDWGGNLQMSTAYLARWGGPVSESDDPYGDDRTPSGLRPRLHVQSVKWLPARADALDNESLKRAILRYGGVYVGMRWEGAANGSTYYNADYASYYYFGYSYANHAVLAVGWDDNYPASNFTMPPAGNGAFIVKNSWGTAFGQDGYFYVSYYDNVFGRTDLLGLVDGAEPVGNYSRLYQYDPLGQVTSLGFNDPTAWFANVFTAKEDSWLSAAGFYTLAPGTKYVVYSGPTLNQLQPLTQGTLAYMGYHTVRLPEPVSLTRGRSFVLAVKLVSPGAEEPVAVEYPLPRFASGATADPGQSYISPDGKEWSDVTVVWDPEANVCLKAYVRASGR